MLRYSNSFVLGLALLLAPFLLCGQSWTPYTADYVVLSVATDSVGKVRTTQITGQQNRASDGSLFETATGNDGLPYSGKLWDASTGKVMQLNYVSKIAVQIRMAPRTHTTLPRADAPVGTQIMDGVTCLEYPTHGPGGKVIGTVWVDEQDDIVIKTEIHDSRNGQTVAYSKTLTNVLFRAPDPSSMKIPSGFEIVQASGTAR